MAIDSVKIKKKKWKPTLIIDFNWIYYSSDIQGPCARSDFSRSLFVQVLIQIPEQFFHEKKMSDELGIEFNRYFWNMMQLPHVRDILALPISDGQKMSRILPTFLDDKYGEVNYSWFLYFKALTERQLESEAADGNQIANN